ncbi:MAG: potassium channel family protein [Actinomycetota bacterium]
MKVAIAGAGKVGRFIAEDLVKRGHEVLLIDRDGEVVRKHRDKIACRWVHADACEPLTLRGAGLDTCEVLVAATGEDRVNLVASLLAKQEFAIQRVIARVNHPKNEWLFNETWGVDAPVSPPHLMTALVEEAVSVGDLITLLELEQGKVLLVEFRLGDQSPAIGKVLGELSLPRDSALVAIVRGGHVMIPREESSLMVGDEILALSTPAVRQQLEDMLAGPKEDPEG